MCQHVLNAQVSFQAPCCKRWFDCHACHAEASDHPLDLATLLAFQCKQCKKAFQKDMSLFDESDELCPHCGNNYVIEAHTPYHAPSTD